MTVSQQAEVIAFLSDPKTYGDKVVSVERQETHGAIVFLAADRAYKLKRAVRYPYMDFSTVALREAMCRRELEVNRRSAPQLYLEVWSILRDGRRFRFGRADEGGDILDWVVVMRRFSQDALLEEMRKSGRLALGLARRLGETVAGFHDAAEVTRDFGGAGGIKAVIDENAAVLGTMPEIFAKADVERLIASSAARLRVLEPLLDARKRSGKVRRCHGDLHLNNIYLDGETPVLFDAIEFEDAFACIDVLYDLALLLMDLDRHGLKAHANALLNRYLEKTFDYEGLAALPLFLSCRAALRAHVRASAALLAANPERAQDLNGDAQDLFGRAFAYLERAAPRIIAVGGLSGTGKSTLAYGLAPQFAPAPGAVVLRSDIFRKHRAAVAETTRLDSGAYAREANAEIYAALARTAHDVAGAGYTAIVDAVFGRAEDRAAIAGTASRAGVSFDGLWLDAPDAALESRIAERHGDASDATVAVLHDQLRTVAVPRDWLRLDASCAATQTLYLATAALAPARLPG